MNTNFHLTVDVNVGLTSSLQALLEALIPSGSPAPVAPTPVVVAEPKAVVAEKNPEKSEQAIKELTEKLDLEPVKMKPAEAVRKAMAECRTRIEGEDYTKDSPFHKELTAEFKKLANLLESEKPSELPADKVESFVDSLSHIVVVDGKLSYDTPF